MSQSPAEQTTAAPDPGAREFYPLGPGAAVLPVHSPTLPPATHTNVYLLGAVVVDPGCNAADEQDRLAQAAAAAGAQAILLSHHHVDHIAGAEALRSALDIPIWAHEATAARVEFSVDKLLSEGPLPLSPGWELLHTPGHAPGHLCAFHSDSGQLFCGDMVSTLGSIFVGGVSGDMRAYITQLERLRALSPARMYPSHGPVECDPVGKLSGYIAHRRAREDKVLQALLTRGPSTAVELLPIAYRGTPAAMAEFATLSCEAHLVKLVEDGKIDRAGEQFLPRG